MQEKIKIAEVILDLRKRAGAEVFFHDLCSSLSSHSGIELSLVLLWDDFDQSFADLHDCNLHIFYCHKHKGIDFKASRIFKSIIKRINPDIIHTHRSILPTYFLAFGAKKQKWKLVHTYHNMAEKEAPKLTRLLQKYFLRRKMIFPVGISDIISKTVSDLYKITDVKTIYNGCDFKTVVNNTSKKYDLISVARFTKQKNLSFLLSVFEKVLLANKTSKLLMLGDGPLFESIKKEAKDKGIDFAITFAGQVSNVNEYLSISKIFLLTSLYEGNPISVLEAMHSGLPVVSSAVGGVPDIIKHGVNGYLCEVNNLDNFVQSINDLLSDEENFIRIGTANVKDSQKYSIEKTAGEYLNFFLELVHADNN